MTQPGSPLGKPQRRLDGRAKVTGTAIYAGEAEAEGLLHGVVVSSTIARGSIRSLDVSAALAVPGVVTVFTHENRPSLAWFDRSYRDDDAPAGSPLRPLRSADIVYSGQPIALVVAEDFETARYAATLIAVGYDVETPSTDLRAAWKTRRKPKKGKLGYEGPPKKRGEPDEILARAPHKIDARYDAPIEHHNPMEMHASTVVVEADGKLTIWDKTQSVLNSQTYVCKVFGLKKEQVRVRSPFVGGAFGSGLRPQYQLFLAVLAARELGRSVRVTLTRQQMFTFGHRPATTQRIALAASVEGTLTAAVHEAVTETSRYEDYVENVVGWSGTLYPIPNARADHQVVPLDLATPLDMRAPGACWGVHAIECALDELAYEIGIDPLSLRLRNYTDRDTNKDKPFSSKELRACYEQGAARFGWGHRSHAPTSMRDGARLVGWGMATGVWDAMQVPARAKASLGLDGRLRVASATADIGTGTYTVMAQIAADALGLPLTHVSFALGDSHLPFAPLEGGSFTVASVGTAVRTVCLELRQRLFELASGVPGHPLGGATLEQVTFVDGRITTQDGSGAVSYRDAMRHGGVFTLEADTTAIPDLAAQLPFAKGTHSAVFAEVKVDPDFGTVEVSRVVSAIAAGRILNPKAARSQILGSVVWGIGMALHEETLCDHALGRLVNHSFAEYHVPVNADVHDIDVIFVEEHDTIVNPLGAKGVGEIGIIGVSAAIANAIFHATGTRVRSLPITLDKLIAPTKA